MVEAYVMSDIVSVPIAEDAEALAIQGCSTQLLDSLCQVLQFAKQDLSVQSNRWGVVCVCVWSLSFFDHKTDLQQH